MPLLRLLSLALCLTFAPLASPARAADERPRINILFMMDDQHRADCIGADGSPWIHTPHLDRLAAEGALFTKMYSSLPSCLPARASLLTGQSPWRHGLLGYAPMAPSYPHTMPRMLRDAGYRTHAVGKNHFEGRDYGYESAVLEEAWRGIGGRGFQCDYRAWFAAHHPDKNVDATGLGYTDHRGGRPFPYDDALHATHWTADRAIDFLQTYDGERPWFLKVSFQRPHPPFDPPARWLKRYEDAELPAPRAGAWADEWHGDIERSLEKAPNIPRGRVPDDEARASRAAYFAAVSFVDEQVGRIIEALRQRGELENTLIVFTSDHGDMMGDQHLWRKCYAYEGSARVPLIVSWPEALGVDASRGRRIEALVELRDILPTFLDAAGIEKPEAMDGLSVLPLLRGHTAGWRTRLDLEHAQIYWPGNAWVALTDGRHKYIYFTTLGRQQLFDLDADPHELNDLAVDAEHATLLAQWRKRMIEHLAPRGREWVADGDLVVMPRSPIRSPHFNARHAN